MAIVEGGGEAFVVTIGVIRGGRVLAVFARANPPGAGAGIAAGAEEPIANVIGEAIVFVDEAGGVGEEYLSGG